MRKTCKDCIHYEVCKPRLKESVSYFKDCKKDCICFSDKADFIDISETSYTMIYCVENIVEPTIRIVTGFLKKEDALQTLGKLEVNCNANNQNR
jgi:uncharacterized protein (UPF0179 family)